ncbi:MAG TPA: sigma 54-interacting transcriptional regulator [Polyangiaceae bacterium]|nr:sigma 54-interacting transcriptional regulator [Polyangiaceae bacterium]
MPDPAELTTVEAQAPSEVVRLKRVVAEVTGGPDKGLTIALGASDAFVGSGADCDLCLTDAYVSRRHVRIRPSDTGVKVIDLGSRNGTYFSGARFNEILLQQDGVVTLGSTTLSLRLESQPLEVALSSRTSFGRAAGSSASMRALFALLDQAASRDVTVLLEGDSGTGKDVLALSIHQESARREGPFVIVDCGSIPPNLIESELFGHERGAFTGAVASREGAFEQAHGGTIFLDEVGELPLELQPKLLRALEARSFRRVGGAKNISVDVRVVAATNRRLKEAVRRGQFRADLFYRLAVVYIKVPSLRERPDDIAPLAEMFLQRALDDEEARLPPDLLPLLTAYEWPGNVRELRNVVERFATFQRADRRLLFDHGGAPSTRSPGPGLGDPHWLATLPYHEARREALDAFHREVLPLVIQRAGSITLAAKQLDMPRASIYRILRRLGKPVDEED